jgi:hypothetical protein
LAALVEAPSFFFGFARREEKAFDTLRQVGVQSALPGKKSSVLHGPVREKPVHDR